MLNGWKAIAAYLRRDERTAMRWAAGRGLPVHRTPGRGRGSVYAIAEEIDLWLMTNRERPNDTAPTTAAVPQHLANPVPIEVNETPVARPRMRPGWLAAGMSVVFGIVLIGIATLMMRHSDRSAAQADAAFSDPAVNAMFLQASYDWNLRTPGSLARAVKEYGDTVGQDPRVPSGYVGLANSYLLLREYGSMRDAEAYARAEAAARAAVALSPSSASAHRALAFIAFWWRQDIPTARREFERAAALKPNDPLTHHWLATALLANGEPAAALQEIDKARDLDPAATSVLADRGLILYVAGRRAEGVDSLLTLTREQPGAVSAHRSLAEIALYEGHLDGFLEQTAIAAKLRGDAAQMNEVRRWQTDGRNVRVVEAAMLQDARQIPVGWFRVARLSALEGRHDDAKEALAHACSAHEPASISAPSDLWLSRSLTVNDIADVCGNRPSLL